MPPKKPSDKKVPSCCMSKKEGSKLQDSSASFNPNAHSSFLKNETFPDMSILPDSDIEEDIAGDDQEQEILDVSPITSESDVEEAKPACCKTKTPESSKRKTQDPSITYSPLPPPGGTYSLSRSMAQSNYTGSSFEPGGATYHATRNYTDMGPWRNFNIPANLQRQNIPAGAHRSFPRTHVPRPSRNYSTYDDPQPIIDLKEVAEFRRRAPRYFSTPQSAGFRGGEGLNDSTVWGQDQSSFDPTNESSAWSQGVRMDSFNVIKQMTPSPKNVRVPPRMNQSYAHPAAAATVNPAYLNVSAPVQRAAPYNFYYNQSMLSGATYSRPQSAQMQGTFTRPTQMNSTYARPQPLLNVTYARPQSAQMNSTFARPRMPQTNVTYVKPQSAPRSQTPQLNSTYVRPQSSQMNATYARPQSAQMNSTFSRPQSGQVDESLPPCCRPKTADATFQRPKGAVSQKPGGDTCSDGTCGRKNKTRNIDHCDDNTCEEQVNVTFNVSKRQSPYGTPAGSYRVDTPTGGQELAVYEPPYDEMESQEDNFDTLLEIRTPRRSTGQHTSSPLQLSINVSCADRSVVITPDQRYNVMNTTPPSYLASPPSGGRPDGGCPGGNNAYNKSSRCCQCG